MQRRPDSTGRSAVLAARDVTLQTDMQLAPVVCNWVQSFKSQSYTTGMAMQCSLSLTCSPGLSTAGMALSPQPHAAGTALQHLELQGRRCGPGLHCIKTP